PGLRPAGDRVRRGRGGPGAGAAGGPAPLARVTDPEAPGPLPGGGAVVQLVAARHPAPSPGGRPAGLRPTVGPIPGARVAAAGPPAPAAPVAGPGGAHPSSVPVPR